MLYELLLLIVLYGIFSLYLMEEVPYLIIGGGAVGLAISRELAALVGSENVYVIDKNSTLGDGQSGRSSEVLHSGIYVDGLKARLTIEGNALLRDFCHKRGIGILESGKFVVVQDRSQEHILEIIVDKAAKHGVPGLEIISARELQAHEPNIAGSAALWSKTTATFDTSDFLYKLAAEAENAGAMIRQNQKVTSIEPVKDGFAVHIQDKGNEGNGGNVLVKYLINAAGLYCEDMARQVNPGLDFEIRVIHGELMNIPNQGRYQVRGNIYPVPTLCHNEGKEYFKYGLHLTPTADGKVLRVGPWMTSGKVKEDYQIYQTTHFFAEQACPFFLSDDSPENVKKEMIKELTALLQKDYSGNMASAKGLVDFQISWDKVHPQCLHLLGIDSPGLTASLAIGKYVGKMFEEKL